MPVATLLRDCGTTRTSAADSIASDGKPRSPPAVKWPESGKERSKGSVEARITHERAKALTALAQRSHGTMKNPSSLPYGFLG